MHGVGAALLQLHHHVVVLHPHLHTGKAAIGMVQVVALRGVAGVHHVAVRRFDALAAQVHTPSLRYPGGIWRETRRQVLDSAAVDTLLDMTEKEAPKSASTKSDDDNDKAATQRVDDAEKRNDEVRSALKDNLKSKSDK